MSTYTNVVPATEKSILIDWEVNFKTFLYSLLLIDLVFILLHLGIKTIFTLKGVSTELINPMFLLDHDQGYAEVYQFGKELAISVTLLIIGIKKRQFLYMNWAVLFFYLFLDDAFSFHEIGGIWLSDYFAFEAQFHLRPVDFGELLISASSGLVLLSLIGIATLKAEFNHKLISFSFFLLLIVLVIFGVGVDMLHIIADNVFEHRRGVGAIFGIIEDGGEMVVMSIICAYAFVVYQNLSLPVKDSELPMY
jgi:hypothetical protein